MYKKGDKLIEIQTNKIFTFDSYQHNFIFESGNSDNYILEQYDFENGLISLLEDSDYYHLISQYISINEYRKQKLIKIQNVKKH